MNHHLIRKFYREKDINHIEEVADYLETIPYEVMCLVSKRVPRIYVS